MTSAQTHCPAAKAEVMTRYFAVKPPEGGKETEQGAEKNRRVEFNILEQEKVTKTVREDQVPEDAAEVEPKGEETDEESTDGEKAEPKEGEEEPEEGNSKDGDAKEGASE